jgi:choline dehydrogenase-like flavoprotein
MPRAGFMPGKEAADGDRLICVLIDGKDLPVGRQGRLAAEIVIVGSGPAGLVSAMELSRRGRDVIVLEAGGLPPDDSRGAYFNGENAGRDYDLVWSRYRAVGGATNAWGGWCRPLDPYEMEQHPWVGGLPWPMSHRELTSYAKTAATMLGLGPWNWNAARIAASQGRASLEDLPGGAQSLAPVVWRYASHPLSFADRFRDYLNDPKSRVVFNAPVVRVDARGRSARGVHVMLNTGRRITITCDTLVLAAGGIETIRLLLETQARLRGAGVVLDRSGWLGRGWQEHPHVPIGTALVPESVAEGPLWLYTGRRDVGGVPVMAGLTFPTSVLKRHRLSALSVTINSVVSTPLAPYSTGMRHIAESIAHEPTPVRQLFARSESRTLRQSRVTLSERRDALGRQQARLDWRLAEGDYRDLGVAARLMALAFAQLGLGVVHQDAGKEELLRRIRGGAHHIGGARMSRDPKEGVTDGFGALHQMPNVFVAGSATFPSGGFSNPTLTIMALALRQARFIASRRRP